MGDAQYIYQRERREFGKQCVFSDKKYLMCSIPSNHDEFRDFILKDPVERGTQLGKQYALSEVNTERTDFEHKAINHTEGGWPKDINPLDIEQTTRYKRKLEKDDLYITQVLRLSEVRFSSCKSHTKLTINKNCIE
jgi:dynein intermediate chain 2